MARFDDVLEKLPSSDVLDAVEKSPEGRVVVSDVAAAAGVSLSRARRDLTTLASLTRADLAVSDDGDLVYTFPDSVKAALAANSAKYRALETYNDKVKPVLFYLLRVSFGVVLLASLAAIFTSIFVISSSSSSSDDDRRRDDRGFGGGGGFGGPSYFWGPSPFDFFYYRPYYGYYYTAPGQPRRDPDEMGFLESVFSYLFGDGDPNAQLETRRLSLVANLIRRNNGAVTAEQLAPFCDGGDNPDEELPPPPADEDVAYVNESFVLPIVTQLGGEPRVTNDGDIVYVFPELQLSAASSSSLFSSTTTKADDTASILKRAGLRPSASAAEIKALLQVNGISTRGALEKSDLVDILKDALPDDEEDDDEDEDFAVSDSSLLQERSYKFSLAPGFNRVLAGALGVVNLGGALYLGNLFAQYAYYGVRLPSFLGTVQAFYPALLAYAVLFNAIPIVRSFWINRENAQIRERNQRRRLWKTALESGGKRIKRKLAAAKKLGTKMKQLGASTDTNYYYDTSKSLNEQEKKRQQEFLEEFDRLLSE